MVLLRELLLQPSLPDGTCVFGSLPGAPSPSLSNKNWNKDDNHIPDLAPIYANLNFDQINEVFGAETALDNHLLNKDVSRLNSTSEWLQSEGDSVRTFYTHIASPVQLAFQTSPELPFIVLRSESGPLGPTQMPPGFISPDRWRGLRNPDGNRRRLGRELRGYAQRYGCYAASAFDGQYFLILLFKAQTVQNIAQINCPVTGLIFSANAPTLRYALFRTITQEVRRMFAEPGSVPPVMLDGYSRNFRMWTWLPFWAVETAAGFEEYDEHPNGYIRMFSAPSGGRYYWADRQGTPVAYQNGEFVWDTFPLAL
ncbi:hypothetical protein QBC38DRAFT_462078 [Podospora fimiseda]|uniref:Uncharacterized protein n=1 Tax=Podospora fimiseda TaxID=252190 RepID=A0AAN6YN98_9PEZI|nr:hypothetical protein QBC38DRAFT_462078 [Podospora fimiseda]